MTIYSDGGSLTPKQGSSAVSSSTAIEFDANAQIPSVFADDGFLPDAFVMDPDDLPDAFVMDSDDLPEGFDLDVNVLFDKKQIKQLKDGVAFDKILDGFAYDEQLSFFNQFLVEGLPEGQNIKTLYKQADDYQDDEFLSDIEYDEKSYYNPKGQGFRQEHLDVQNLRFRFLSTLFSSAKGKTHEEKVGRFLLNIDLEKKTLSRNGGIRSKQGGAVMQSLQEQELFLVLDELEIDRSDYRKILVNNPEKFKAVLSKLDDKMAAIKTYTAKGLTSRNKALGIDNSGINYYTTGKNRHTTYARGLVAASVLNATLNPEVRAAKHFRTRYLQIFKSQHIEMLQGEASNAKKLFNASRSKILAQNMSHVKELKKLKRALSVAKRTKDATQVSELTWKINQQRKILKSAFATNKSLKQVMLYQRLIGSVRTSKSFSELRRLRSLTQVAQCANTGKLVAGGTRGAKLLGTVAQSGKAARAVSWTSRLFRAWSFGKATVGATAATAAGATAIGTGASLATATGLILPIAGSFLVWEGVTGLIEGAATDWKSDSYNVKILKGIGSALSSVFSYD